jgi:hypothetical protein
MKRLPTAAVLDISPETSYTSEVKMKTPLGGVC